MSDDIATYTFLPWLRQGLASKIERTDDQDSVERASIQIFVEVNGDPAFASGDIQLVGPGDVIGINPRAIVRTEPRN